MWQVYYVLQTGDEDWHSDPDNVEDYAMILLYASHHCNALIPRNYIIRTCSPFQFKMLHFSK